jgi:hypothetical protein
MANFMLTERAAMKMNTTVNPCPRTVVLNFETQEENGMTDQKPCAEKHSRLRDYQKATEAYSKAVKDLANRRGITSRSDYDRLHRAAEQARHASMDALDRLEDHRLDHGC